MRHCVPPLDAVGQATNYHVASLGEIWGDTKLVLPRGLAAHVDVATHDGSLRTTFPLDRRDASHAAGDLNGGGPPIVVRTGDGSIRLDAI